MSIKLISCRSVPPELLRSFLCWQLTFFKTLLLLTTILTWRWCYCYWQLTHLKIILLLTINSFEDTIVIVIANWLIWRYYCYCYWQLVHLMRLVAAWHFGTAAATPCVTLIGFAMEGGPMRLLITIWYILESQNHIHKTKAFFFNT